MPPCLQLLTSRQTFTQTQSAAQQRTSTYLHVLIANKPKTKDIVGMPEPASSNNAPKNINKTATL